MSVSKKERLFNFLQFMNKNDCKKIELRCSIKDCNLKLDGVPASSIADLKENIIDINYESFYYFILNFCEMCLSEPTDEMKSLLIDGEMFHLSLNPVHTEKNKQLNIEMINLDKYIKEEFSKHPFIMKILLNFGDLKKTNINEINQIKDLFDNDNQYKTIKDSRLNYHSFTCFSELHSHLTELVGEKKIIQKVNFFNLSRLDQINILEKNDIEYHKENENLIILCSSFEKSKIISPSKWCISTSEFTWTTYNRHNKEQSLIILLTQYDMIGISVYKDRFYSFNRGNEKLSNKELNSTIKKSSKLNATIKRLRLHKYNFIFHMINIATPAIITMVSIFISHYIYNFTIPFLSFYVGIGSFLWMLSFFQIDLVKIKPVSLLLSSAIFYLSINSFSFYLVKDNPSLTNIIPSTILMKKAIETRNEKFILEHKNKVFLDQDFILMKELMPTTYNNLISQNIKIHYSKNNNSILIAEDHSDIFLKILHKPDVSFFQDSENGRRRLKSIFDDMIQYDSLKIAALILSDTRVDATMKSYNIKRALENPNLSLEMADLLKMDASVEKHLNRYPLNPVDIKNE
jgi:hypothetical protein